MESSNPESRPRLYIIVLFQDMRYVDIIHVYIYKYNIHWNFRDCPKTLDPNSLLGQKHNFDIGLRWLKQEKRVNGLSIPEKKGGRVHCPCGPQAVWLILAYNDPKVALDSCAWWATLCQMAQLVASHKNMTNLQGHTNKFETCLGGDTTLPATGNSNGMLPFFQAP